MIAIDMAARITTGRPMPLSDAAPILGNVLFQSNEDEKEDTLLPRCLAAGAEPDRIESIEAVDLNFDEDCHIIEQHIQETNARFVCFDPLQGFTGPSCRYVPYYGHAQTSNQPLAVSPPEMIVQ